MKPFNFFPIASGASKVQPMSASDITRINRIRASNGAYPNILSNPPKNISNLALSQTVISSFHMNNAINRGIFVYRPVVTSNNSNNDTSGNGVIEPDYGQPVDTAKIINNKLRVVFRYSNDFNDFTLTIYPVVGYTSDLTRVEDLTLLDTNIYLYERDISLFDNPPVVGTTVEFYFYFPNDFKTIVVS